MGKHKVGDLAGCEDIVALAGFVLGPDKYYKLGPGTEDLAGVKEMHEFLASVLDG